jgi:hypothetical protein
VEQKHSQGLHVLHFLPKSLAVAILFFAFSLPGFSFASAPDATCLIADESPTVVIDGCDTGVANAKDSGGCTIWQRIINCNETAKKHSDFTKCVSKVADTLKKSGLITAKEKQTIQKCAAKASYPCTDCGPKSVGPKHFAFESGRDELSVALKKVYDAFVTSLESESDMEILMALREEGLLYLRQHPDQAFAALRKETSHIDPIPEYSRLLVIFHLMSAFESEAGIRYLFDWVKTPIPSDCRAEEGAEETCTRFSALRQSALSGLGDISSLGSATAKARLLDLVAQSDLSVQRDAIKIFYQTAGISRWRAKRLLSGRLPGSKHYLLHEIY